MIYLDDMVYAMLNLNPMTVFYIIIYKNDVPPMFRLFANLIESLKNIGLKFTLPVINFEIDVGAVIAAALNWAINFIKFLFTLLIDLFFILCKAIFQFIIKPIFSALLWCIANFREIISTIFNTIAWKLEKIVWLIKQPFMVLSIIGLDDIITLIFDSIVNAVTSVFAVGAQFLSIFPTLIMYAVVIYLFFLIVVPVIGVLMSLGTIVKGLVYMVLNCDDDEDFYFIFINIVNSLFKTKI